MPASTWRTPPGWRGRRSGATTRRNGGAGTFREALLQRCRVSRFGNWKQRATLIEDRADALRTSAPDALTPYERRCQADLIARKSRLVQLASRHKPAPGRPAGVPVQKPVKTGTKMGKK